MKQRNTTYVVYGTEVIKVSFSILTEDNSLDAIDTDLHIWDENEHQYLELENSTFYQSMSESELAVIQELINTQVKQSLGILEETE
jgi:hypothetical protein